MAAGLVAPMALFGWAGWASVEQLERELMTERQLFSKSVASHIEHVIRSDLGVLQAVGSVAHLGAAEPGLERSAVREAYLRSHFLEGVLLFGEGGKVLWEEPARGRPMAARLGGLPAVQEAFRTGRPTVSGVVDNPDGTKRLYALVPLRDWQGTVVRVVAGEMDPGSPRFTSLLQPFRFGHRGSTDLVDSHGTVIATTDPSRLYLASDHRHFIAGLIREQKPAVGSCHGCHEANLLRGRVREVLAFAPLSVVPWGIATRQPEDEAFASTAALRRRLLLLGPAALAVAVLFAWGAARSIRKPLALLTEAAERIAAGGLDAPIPPLGEDEVGRLGRSLEEMRIALRDSLAAIAGANQQLERRVEERTQEIERLYRALREREELRGQLLRKVITAQEDERRRIARGLHDDTSQALVALVMALDTTATTLGPGPARERLAEAKALAVRSLDDLHRLLFDLRPSVLDDLGLLSAIRWYAERHLEPLGIAVRCEFADLDGRLPPEVEIALFRVVQEAVTNIARHAEAETVLIQCALREGVMTVEIEDDGKGFDATRGPEPSGSGLGLLGIRERVELLGGRVDIESAPGQGTRIALAVPAGSEARRG
jgi:signal transduction histidine kinase